MAQTNTYLEAIRSDYASMLETIALAKNNASGFHALSLSNLEEVKEAYQSEQGRKILRNAYKVFFALEKLEKELEQIED